MKAGLERALSINVDKFGGERAIIDDTISWLEQFVQQEANRGPFDSKYSPKDIEKTRQRIQDLQAARKWGNSRTARWN